MGGAERKAAQRLGSRVQEEINGRERKIHTKMEWGPGGGEQSQQRGEDGETDCPREMKRMKESSQGRPKWRERKAQMRGVKVEGQDQGQ